MNNIIFSYFTKKMVFFGEIKKMVGRIPQNPQKIKNSICIYQFF